MMKKSEHIATAKEPLVAAYVSSRLDEYEAPTEFNFGHNIHDFDPDKQRTSGKRMQDISGTAWYEREPDVLSIYSLVSEIKERIASITKLVKEEGTMIEYKDDGRGKRGPSSNTTTLPTLKPENMTFEKRLLRILATRKVNGRFGEQVALKVVYASQTWLWYQAITKSNPILSFLVDKFGADETAWPGNEVLLFLQHDEFDNRNRPAVELSSDKKKK